MIIDVIRKIDEAALHYDHHDARALAEMSKRDKHFYGILFSQMVLEGVAKENGHSSFGTIASFWPYFRTMFWTEWMAEVTHMFEATNEHNHGVTPINVCPFVGGEGAVNVISPLHLIAQGITLDNVLLQFRARSLMEQRDITYEMIEECLQLPGGYLSDFEDGPKNYGTLGHFLDCGVQLLKRVSGF